MDMGTKYYLTANVRDWANRDDNALVLLQNPKVKELTEADLSWNSTDDVVWTIMYLIGAGLLRYVITDNGQVFEGVTGQTGVFAKQLLWRTLSAYRRDR